MGYTHYWKFKPTANTELEFKEVLNDCQIIMANAGDIIIRGGDGISEPEFNETNIWINGDEMTNDDYETFFFSPTEQKNFAFCKTARKPYDLIVGAILLSLAHRLTGFSFSSDGEYVGNEWIPIFNFYESIGLEFNKGEKEKLIHNL